MFEFTTPLTVAETASIFGETIVLERLLTEAPDAAARLSLLAESLDGAVAAVFRQIAMNRFEHRIHTERRESGELSTDAFAAAWSDTQADLLGDSVEPSEDYASWWSYVPHFVNTPGYVYAYAYGHLLALSVYRRFEEEGPGFIPVLPGPAARRRLDAARGAGADRGRRPDRPGLLELGPRPDRAPAGPGRAGRGGGRPRLTHGLRGRGLERTSSCRDRRRHRRANRPAVRGRFHKPGPHPVAPGLADRALQTLLLGPLSVVSLLCSGLAPGQSDGAFGVEIR